VTAPGTRHYEGGRCAGSVGTLRIMTTYVQGLTIQKDSFGLAESLEACGLMGVDLAEIRLSESPEAWVYILPDAKLSNLREEEVGPGIEALVGDSRRVPNPVVLPLANLVLGAAGIYAAIKGIG
jgi:hypothetical protein